MVNQLCSDGVHSIVELWYCSTPTPSKRVEIGESDCFWGNSPNLPMHNDSYNGKMPKTNVNGKQ